jgi:Flp pilus assembly protein TadD
MTATAVSELQIRNLIEAIDRADLAGNRREADRALAQARAAAPDHPGVLNVAGMRALLGGDAGAARALLERAAALDPASPMLWLNLAFVHRELHDEAAERNAVEKALAVDPRFFPALLHKARLLER